jgi:unsaturated chondroitin disaccharide hydrolase
MPLRIDTSVTAQSVAARIHKLFELSAEKIMSLEKSWDPRKGTPVFTIAGRYASRGWTEWTQGFQYGAALLQFDATGEKRFLELGRTKTVGRMAPHISHMGVHDHGFNNVSTYGNLWRLMAENKIPFNKAENDFYELALKLSGAVQAARYTSLPNKQGYIYSFNGPHSLFVDTMRSLRSLALAHQLGHVLMGERDQKINLLERLITHANTTAAYNVYYGLGRDSFDVAGRTAHESVFNVNDGSYRCPSSQQGYSPFTTWTRGLAWAICGYAEQLEFLQRLATPRGKISKKATASLTPSALSAAESARVQKQFLKPAIATADFYLQNCCTDGIPMWDTGAPNLHRLGDYLDKPADPFNAWEPVDSSAAAIAAQGLLRLGNSLRSIRQNSAGKKFIQAGLSVAATLMSDPYISTNPRHQGLLLHSVYHRPNGWDHIAPGQKVPNGESSMWGDYHLMELALLILRQIKGDPYLTFFGP